jgi:hypothetical protein
MGAANVRTIQHSSTRMNAAVGRSCSPLDNWPGFEVMHYPRTIDCDPKSSRAEFTRRQGNDPPRERRARASRRRLRSPAASMPGIWMSKRRCRSRARILSRLPIAEFWQLDVSLTPDAVLKAAQAANPTAISITLPPGAESLGRVRRSSCRSRPWASTERSFVVSGIASPRLARLGRKLRS